MPELFHKKRIADLTDKDYIDYYSTISEKELLMLILKELQK